MILKYQSGEEIKDHDRVLFHREAAELAFSHPPLPTQKQGGGVMIKASAHTFVPASQLDDYEDLEFVSRSNLR